MAMYVLTRRMYIMKQWNRKWIQGANLRTLYNRYLFLCKLWISSHCQLSFLSFGISPPSFVQQAFCIAFLVSVLFPLSRYEDSVLIVLSIFEDFGYFICPQTGIGLNSSVHSMGSILHSWPVNTPWTPLNTFSLNTSENRKSLYFKGFSGVFTSTFQFDKFTSTFQFDNLTGSPVHIVHIDGVVGSSPTVTTTLKPL